MYAIIHLNIISRDHLKSFLDVTTSTFQAATKRSNKRLMQTEYYLIDFFCRQCSNRNALEIHQIFKTSNVREMALDRLFQCVPHVFGLVLDRKDEVEVKSHLLNQVRTFIMALSDEDNYYYFRYTKGFLIFCLKHGINDESNPLSSHCIGLLLQMIRWSGRPNGLSILPLSAAQIFLMAVSHSKFNRVLSADCTKAKEDLLSLLIVCASQDSSIKGEREVFRSLLTRYNASLGHEDKLTRQLLYQLCENYLLDSVSYVERISPWCLFSVYSIYFIPLFWPDKCYSFKHVRIFMGTPCI
jgi:hypothetical protein